MTAPALIEGRNAVIEAMRSGMPLARILLAEGVKDSDATAEIERLAREHGVRVERIARRKLEALSDHGSHQGVVAEAAPFSFASLEAVLSRVGDAPKSLLIVLDHVTDPGNLGAVVRSAEVAGAHAVIVPSRRSAAVGPAAFKASAGALAHLPLVQETNLVRVLERLKEAGYWIAGADGTARQMAWDAPLEGRLALVMGSEGSGLSRLVRETCDFLVALPVAGRVDSLNVAQATSILAFEWVRRGRGI
jgi:23S rRNA (guanosine2251-2'-O)-methyltransferase